MIITMTRIMMRIGKAKASSNQVLVYESIPLMKQASNPMFKFIHDTNAGANTELE